MDRYEDPNGRYVTKQQFTAQKSRLTRATKAGPLAVLVAVEKTLDEWAGKAWPDDWSRWARALDDAYYTALRSDDHYPLADETVSRFRAAFDRIHS